VKKQQLATRTKKEKESDSKGKKKDIKLPKASKQAKKYSGPPHTSYRRSQPNKVLPPSPSPSSTSDKSN
jgi:hypothetical protein